MSERTLLCNHPNGTHNLSYQDWGSIDAKKALVCVHGLTRNSRDFDFVAQALANLGGWYIVCPDLPGRGSSGWLDNAELYNFEQYTQDLQSLLECLPQKEVHWLGSSLGGLIGMAIASLPDTPIRSLTLNDIGPYLLEAEIHRYAHLLQEETCLPSLEAMNQYLRAIYQDIGEQSDDYWAHLTQHDHQQLPDGTFRRNYDPKISQGLLLESIDNERLWGAWMNIHCPIYVIRGAESELFPQQLLDKMLATKESIESSQLPGVGHAPALATSNEIDLVVNWLQRQ